MKNETSEDLLVYISLQEEHPKQARLAFEEFYYRYKEDVWKTAFMLTKDTVPNGDVELAKQIMQDTFIKVNHHHQSKGKFDLSKAKNKDNAIKAWLFSIAKYTFKDYLKSKTKQRAFISQSEFDEEQHPRLEKTEAEPQSFSVTMADLQSALNSLKERERTILLISAKHQEEGKIPKWLRIALCEQYNTTDANLRQIRHRAMKKLLIFLAKLGYEVPDKISLYAISA